MKVLLIQPPIRDFYTTPIRLYPLGLLYAARVFQHEGVEVQILDCLSPLKKKKIPVPDEFAYLSPFLRENPYLFKGFYRFGLPESEIASKIASFSPDAVGISSQFTSYFTDVENVARLVKSCSNVPVFIGGHHATVFASQIKVRTDLIDHVCVGQAEESVPALCRKLKGENHETPLSVDWRRLHPAHELIDASMYQIGKRRALSLIAGRGCPMGCEFCSTSVMFGRKTKYRDIDHIIMEMRKSYLERNVRIFNFEDDNLSFDRTWFFDFLKSVSEDQTLKNIEVTAMNGVCYSTLDGQILEQMKRVGFRRLNLSLVTKSKNLQQKFGRIGEIAQFEEIIRKARALDFFITVYLILGLPEQTRKEIEDTIDYLFKMGVLVGPSVFYLPPGSPLYEKLSVSTPLLENWDLYRSSAFAVETSHLSRHDLVDLFCEIRRRNLERRTS
ncbi:MAG: cobalamin-dependent protein [Thermodesulfobacteriota bacterium]